MPEGIHKFRLKLEDNNILYLNSNHSFSSLSGYLQSNSGRTWKRVGILHKPQQQLICKSFGFLHHHYTGIYEHVSVLSHITTIHCKPYAENLKDFFLSKGRIL